MAQRVDDVTEAGRRFEYRHAVFDLSHVEHLADHGARCGEESRDVGVAEDINKAVDLLRLRFRRFGGKFSSAHAGVGHRPQRPYFGLRVGPLAVLDEVAVEAVGHWLG